MSQLPVLSGAQTVDNFRRHGWNVARRRGSHTVMTKLGAVATLSVPSHSTVAKGTLRSLIRSAGLTVGEFCSTL